MTRHFGDLVLVEHENDVLNWSATNEDPLPARIQKKCKSTRCFHLSNSTIAICSFLVFFSVISLTIYFGLRQHMNGPEAAWSNVMVNDTKNATATKVQLPYGVSHHSWEYNKLILHAWLGTCLSVGLLITLTLIILVCTFLWKKHKKTLRKHRGKLQENNYNDIDVIEMKGSMLTAHQSVHPKTLLSDTDK
ncbi:uncharacterized protein LOC116297903 [Actinia tenebrosa]|uniref:Uncharacterized protein LOC116297903 n=1 Tax=Actinia tenebrosa TaxID=6105 RepID=A0A6P8I3L9_ACTTE|nr:uncharacterized protein LOC116297903 [Actinia tenebrosa]